MSNLTKASLIFIVLMAFVIRVYKVDSIPPSLTWDEVDVGYNAWTIVNFGRDEWGNVFPLVFKSFGDDKHPVHIYTTAISVLLLGLSEFSTRFPSVVIGAANVLLIFFLTKKMFGKSGVGLLSAFFLAISPYNIHFSRFNHEANFALFFFMIGLYLFFISLKNKGFLPLSLVFFVITSVTYHSAKVVVPIVLIILLVSYYREIIKNKFDLFLSGIVILSFVGLLIFEPRLVGGARISQTALSREDIRKTIAYQKFQNELFGKINLIFNQYLMHFTPQYLFVVGDKNPRLHSQVAGQFYKIDALFFLVGLIYLLRHFSKTGLILLSWIVAGPLPASMTAEAPHAARALFMMGSLHILAALGFYQLVEPLRKKFTKIVLTVILLLILGWLFNDYLIGYYGEFSKRYAIDWQYGMKQIVEYVKEHPEYTEVYMTNIRGQPYIFFLYYSRTPLPQFLRSVVYNNGESKSYSLIDFFDRYYFENWDPIWAMPNPGVLYIVSPSQYDGMFHRSSFEIKKRVDYPNGNVAFYLVTKK